MKTRLINTDLLKEASIPKKYWSMGMDTFPGSKESLEQTNHYIRNFGAQTGFQRVGLLFIGPPNSCKTFLATYTLKCLMVKGASCKYFTTESLTEAYLGKHEVNMLTQLKDCNCVVIDNLGVCFNRAMRNAVEKAIRYLSDNLVAYLVCSVIEDMFDLSGQYGEVIASHLETDLIRVDCLPQQKSHFELEMDSLKRQFIKAKFKAYD